MRLAELEKLVSEVIAAVPAVPFEEQPESFQRLIERYARDESERTGVEISAVDYFRRGREATAAETAATDDPAVDEIVREARR